MSSRAFNIADHMKNLQGTRTLASGAKIVGADADSIQAPGLITSAGGGDNTSINSAIGSATGATFNGTVGSSATFPAGHVIQVVQSTSNTLDSTTSETFQDSGLSASLIPASTSNKVLIMSMTTQWASASDDYTGLTIFRGTDATWNTTNLGNEAYGFANFLAVGATLVISNQNINYLDSPNTDVSVKYTMAHRAWSGGTSIVQGNGVTATMILMEIQG